MANRCFLCDYVEGYGSTYTNTHNPLDKVRWNKKENGYICDSCSSVIKTATNTKPLNYATGSVEYEQPSSEKQSNPKNSSMPKS